MNVNVKFMLVVGHGIMVCGMSSGDLIVFIADTNTGLHTVTDAGFKAIGTVLSSSSTMTTVNCGSHGTYECLICGLT